MRVRTLSNELLLCIAAMAGSVITSHCPAADWFVAPVAAEGDGTRAKPFRDPYLALRAAAPGDVIHVAAGVYFGRYDRSSWNVDRPRITIRGGYDPAFTKRTPWQTPSVFAVFSDYEGGHDPNLITGTGDHAGLTLDGLAFDSGGRNMYGDKTSSGLRPVANADGPVASFSAPGVVIRNCIFANGATGGVELSGEGSLFENNLIVNTVGNYMLNLREASAGNKQSIIVRSNTFAFAHDTGEPPLGRGGNYGIAIRVNCPAMIEQNVFYACANFAIRTERKPDRIAVERNVFWLDNFDVVGKRASGDEADIAEKNLEELEDLGLKSSKGNKAADPGLAGMKGPWFDAVSRYMLVTYSHPPIETLTALRAGAGLAAFNPPRNDKPAKPAPPADPFAAPKPAPKVEENPDEGALAPYLPIADCAALHVGVADRGARVEELKVEFGPEPVAAVAQAYQPIDWDRFQRGDPALANQRVELRCGLGFEQNSFVLNDVAEKEFVGFQILYPGKTEFDTPFLVYTKRGGSTHRQYDLGEKYPGARDVEIAYLVRGTCRVDTNVGRQKASLIVDSIAVAPAVFPARPPRPVGHDLFVRAGASGGDGTRELPFRDPFQALDKAEGGDVIHIAGGDYFGKLRSGNWKIPVRNLTILGGYDAGFTARDPWKNPTRLVLAEQEKAKKKHSGTFLESGDVTDGLVLDGLIFDGSTCNKYTDNGALDVGGSPLSSMVDLRGGDIAVRNCVFLNAAGNAISLHSTSGTFENNIVLNTSGWSIGISADGPGPWFIRNNTILFAADWTPNAGTGISSSAGTLLLLRGRAQTTIEGNIFGLADNYGLRCTIAQHHVVLNNNMFVGNAYCHLTDTQSLWAQTDNWARRAASDSDYSSIRGNGFDAPALALDRAWLDKSLSRVFSLPSRFKADEWKRIAGTLGASVVPAVAGSAAPPAAKPKAPAKEASLDDLMADLNKLKTETPGNQTAVAGPPYCAAYDWHKASDLAGDSSTTTVGARKVKLTVSFTGGAAAAAKQYVKVTGAQIDAGREPWEGKAIEIDATGMRSSASGGLFPPDISRNDWDAYTITLTTGAGDARTPAAVLVRKDSNAGKLMDRAGERDTLRFRGTARVIATFRGLCIVADSVERADQ